MKNCRILFYAFQYHGNISRTRLTLVFQLNSFFSAVKQNPTCNSSRFTQKRGCSSKEINHATQRFALLQAVAPKNFDLQMMKLDFEGKCRLMVSPLCYATMLHNFAPRVSFPFTFSWAGYGTTVDPYLHRAVQGRGCYRAQHLFVIDESDKSGKSDESPSSNEEVNCSIHFSPIGLCFSDYIHRSVTLFCGVSRGTRQKDNKPIFEIPMRGG